MPEEIKDSEVPEVSDAAIEEVVVETLAQEGGRASRSGDTDRLKGVVAEMGAISDGGYRLR